MNLCKVCSKKTRICGQAFTKYVCIRCYKPCMHENTCVPNVCKKCSEEKQICQYCTTEIFDWKS